MKKIILSFVIFISIVLFINESYAAPIKFIATKAGLNLRSGPDKSAKTITLIPFGKNVTVIKFEKNELFIDGRFGSWVKVKYDNKIGYVFSGFLCDFNPDDAINYIAKDYKENTKSLEIVYIIENYINLNVPLPDKTSPEMSRGNVIWKYDPFTNQYIEVYNLGHSNTTDILYIDDDRYLDLLVDDGCCGFIELHILLGSENKYTEVYKKNDDCDPWENSFRIKKGKCDQLSFSCIYRNREKNRSANDVDILNHFRFNCQDKKFEKYDSNNVKEDVGIIKIINSTTNTIILDINGQEIEYHTYDEMYNVGLYKYDLDNLKVGQTVEFWYVEINNKKIVIHSFRK